MQTKHPTLEQVTRLLKACDLPTKDVVSLYLSLFLASEENHQLTGVIGLEVHGSCGLLRSLAVSPCHRNSGSGQTLSLFWSELLASKLAEKGVADVAAIAQQHQQIPLNAEPSDFIRLLF